MTEDRCALPLGIRECRHVKKVHSSSGDRFCKVSVFCDATIHLCRWATRTRWISSRTAGSSWARSCGSASRSCRAPSLSRTPSRCAPQRCAQARSLTMFDGMLLQWGNSLLHPCIWHDAFICNSHCTSLSYLK